MVAARLPRRRPLALCVLVVSLLRRRHRTDVAIRGDKIRNRRHWWSYNHKASPWVEIWPLRGPRPRLYAMVALARATAPAAHRHTWRRNPNPSPWVELQSQSISMGGDIAVQERRIMPSAMISPTGTQSSEGHRHRWRRNPKSPPWVELQSQSISMGGDIAVRERRIMPSAMISPVGTQSSDGHRHRWRRTPKSPP